MRTIYLDYNATTPIAPSVLEAMKPFFVEHYGNPSSDHALGRACHFAIEDAREKVANAIGAEPTEIVFTSCGTESNNLALKGIIQRHAPGSGAHFIVSAIEHPAISVTAEYLRGIGYRLTVCPCDSDGVVAPESIQEAIEERTVLVSVMHANNETGAVQPIREIASICRRRGIPMHTDAAQSVGKIPADVKTLGVDMMTIVGHKLYGPKGIGALYVRRGLAIEPVLHGAAHERGLRAGTENVPYIVGLAKACELASKALGESDIRLAELRDRLQAALVAHDPDVIVHAHNAPRLPNTLSIALPGVSARAVLAKAAEICASTGAACHSGAAGVSATLAAMGVPAGLAAGTLRLSLGWPTSTEEIDMAAERLISAWESLAL
jgi:cysteine desulfurase